ncbi:hypothetical protein [Burkholderia gladioli]|uniref:hypothetical protein n=1 Tax=Burkholderia gladioli TaxID=28095 RepID=UPI001641CC89|nr:hypothetical protein [Burkholderia gladioli]MBU9268197.1 hypothetical protein [Burkholderia gladioli]
MSTPKPQKSTVVVMVSSAFAAGAAVIGLAGGAYKLGHDAGVSDGTAQAQVTLSQDQSTIADLRDKAASATTASTISQANESTARTREGEWRDAYNTLVATNKALSQENENLRSQLSALSPCAYMENQITDLETRIPSTTSVDHERQDLIDQRDRIQEQLSNCKK